MTEEHDIVRILLVEDDRNHADLICRAFRTRAERMSLTVAGTLREARALLAEWLPHLLITNLRLPDGDAMELLTAGKEPPGFPVVVISGDGDEQAAVAAMKAGALDYVVKSAVNPSALPRIADRAIRQWRQMLQRERAEKQSHILSLATEQMTEGMAYSDLEGNVLFVNAAFARMHGHSSD